MGDVVDDSRRLVSLQELFHFLGVILFLTVGFHSRDVECRG